MLRHKFKHLRYLGNRDIPPVTKALYRVANGPVLKSFDHFFHRAGLFYRGISPSYAEFYSFIDHNDDGSTVKPATNGILRFFRRQLNPELYRPGRPVGNV